MAQETSALTFMVAGTFKEIVTGALFGLGVRQTIAVKPVLT